MQSWSPLANNFATGSIITCKHDATADFTNQYPASVLYFVVGNNSNDPTTNVASFDYEGTFSAPVIKSGSYASPSSVLNPAEEVLSTLSAPISLK